MRDEDLRGLRRTAEAQDDAASWSRLAGALARAEQWDEADAALGEARARGGADASVEAAAALGLRGLAEEQGDAASWSRLAAALVRAGRLEDAGEALVRARANGEAAPEVEDALEGQRLEGQPLDGARLAVVSPDVVLGPVDRLALWGSALAWAPDSRALFAYVDGSIVAGRAPDYRLEPIAPCDWIVTALAVDLAGRFLVASRTPTQGFASLLGVLDLGSREWARGKHVRASEGATLVSALACWHRSATVWAGDRSRISGYTRSGLELAGPVRAWAERERVSLAWNGDFLRWPLSVADTPTGPELEDGAAFVPERPRLSFPTRRSGERFRESAAAFRRLRTHEGVLDGVAASPSGRFVAIWDSREPTLGVLDLAGERARRFELPSRARNAAWAPSGRRLVVALQRGIALVEL